MRPPVTLPSGLSLLVAALVIDTVGSTERRAELGELAAEEDRRAVFARIETVIDAHDGRIVAGRGDGVVALFGTTSAAIEAGRALADARFRIGIGVGDVVVVAGAWRGAAIDDAGDLERLCRPGEVLCSADAVAMATIEELGGTPSSDAPGAPVRLARAGRSTGPATNAQGPARS